MRVLRLELVKTEVLLVNQQAVKARASKQIDKTHNVEAGYQRAAVCCLLLLLLQVVVQWRMQMQNGRVEKEEDSGERWYRVHPPRKTGLTHHQLGNRGGGARGGV